MGRIKIDNSVLDQQSFAMLKITVVLGQISNRVNNAKNGLGWQIEGSGAIRSKITNTSTALDQINHAVGSCSKMLASASKKYQQAESRAKNNSAWVISRQDKEIIRILRRWSEEARGIRIFKNDNGFLLSSLAASAGRNVSFDDLQKRLSHLTNKHSKTIHKVSDGREWQKITISDNPVSDMKKYYHKLMGGSFDTTTTETVYTSKGSKSWLGGMFNANQAKSWHTIGGGTEEKGFKYTGFNGTVKNGAYTEMSFSAHTFETKAQSIFQPERGSLYGKGSIGYNLASGSITMKDPVNNLGSVTFTGNVGASANAEFGIHNGVVKISSGGSVGVGGGISLDLDIKNTWSAASSAFSDIGKGLNDLDNKILTLMNS